MGIPMTLQDLGSIGEFLGAIGVIISLVYLATQIRQNTKSIRAAAVDAVADRFIESNRLVSLNPELADLLDAGNYDYPALTDVQKRRYLLHYLANSLQFESVYRKYREGLLPESQWEGVVEALRAMVDLPGLQRNWKEIRLFVGPEFREFIDAMFENAARE